MTGAAPPHVLYLHGFGSGPATRKGAALRERLRGATAGFAIPDLEGGDFSALRVDDMCARARSAHDALPDGAPVLVIGSSLGGYVAALLAAEGALPRASALLLLAPAFGFTERWRERLGEDGIAEWRRLGHRAFYHHIHERELPLGSAFLDSCEPLPPLPRTCECPVAIVHGRRDETVDWRDSLSYAERADHVELHLVDDDHSLTAPASEDLIVACARRLMDRIAAEGAAAT